MFLPHNQETIRMPEKTLPVGVVEIVSEELAKDKEGREFTRRMVRVGDESDRDPAMRQVFRERANADEMQLILNPEWGGPYIGEDGILVINPANTPARRLYLDGDGKPTQMFEWGSQLKKAIALEGLQNLKKGGRFLTLGELDHRTLELFTHMPDGIGLRSRQRIYSNLLVDYSLTSSTGNFLRIASLGSGAAVPNIEATEAIEALGKSVAWLQYELDPGALYSAGLMIASSNIQRSTFDFGPRNDADAAQQTGFEFQGRSYLGAREVEDGSLDAIDALGLWEYLTDKQAVAFLRTLYPKLKPGASMIVSNMLQSRPHPQYNQRAVGWPDLYMRTEEDMLRIVEQAGIPTKNVRLTYAEDGVYVVMEITRGGELDGA